MTTLVIDANGLSQDLLSLIGEIAFSPVSPVCDLEGCSNLHKEVAPLRLSSPRAVDFYFCSDEHRTSFVEQFGSHARLID